MVTMTSIAVTLKRLCQFRRHYGVALEWALFKTFELLFEKKVKCIKMKIQKKKKKTIKNGAEEHYAEKKVPIIFQNEM